MIGSRRKQYTHEGDKNPSIRAADDCLVVGNHAGDGVCPSECDNDSRGAGVLPSHGRAVWKFHDASQSLLLQGAGTDEYGSSPGAGCRADSSAHDCCGTAGRLVRGVDRGDGSFPSFVSSCPTPRTIFRL